jgi:hypothetical protein
MTIETKYNIGQEVWIIFCDNGVAGIIECRVKGIEVKTCGGRRHDIRYRLKHITTTELSEIEDIIYNEYEIPTAYREDFVFPTKEELLKSL